MFIPGPVSFLTIAQLINSGRISVLQECADQCVDRQANTVQPRCDDVCGSFLACLGDVTTTIECPDDESYDVSSGLCLPSEQVTCREEPVIPSVVQGSSNSTDIITSILKFFGIDLEAIQAAIAKAIVTGITDLLAAILRPIAQLLGIESILFPTTTTTAAPAAQVAPGDCFRSCGPEHKVGQLLQFCGDCKQFLHCESTGPGKLKTCPPTLFFDQNKQLCDYTSATCPAI